MANVKAINVKRAKRGLASFGHKKLNMKRANRRMASFHRETSNYQKPAERGLAILHFNANKKQEFAGFDRETSTAVAGERRKDVELGLLFLRWRRLTLRES